MNAATQEQKDLEVMYPTAAEVLLKGERFSIKPFGFRHVKHILKLAGTFKMLANEQPEPTIDAQGIVTTPPAVVKDISKKDLLALINLNADTVTKMIAVSIDRDEAFVDELGVDEVLLVVSKVLEVNVDFFTTHVLPLAGAVMKGLAPLVATLTTAAAGQQS